MRRSNRVVIRSLEMRVANLERSAKTSWSADANPSETKNWLKEFLKNYAKWGGGRVKGLNKIDFSDSAGSLTSTFDFSEWSRDFKSKSLTEKTSIGGETTILVTEGMTPEDAVREMVSKARGKVARLEKKSSRDDDLELAQAIKEYIEEYNNGDVKDLREDPEHSLTMDELENTFPRLSRTIKNWDRRGLLKYHSGTVERKSPGGFHLYDEDWDLTTLNAKGAKLVLELLGL